MSRTKKQTTNEYSSGGVVYRQLDGGYEIVAVQRARHDDWSLPKGHIEEGESLEEAALREVREETGLEARIVSPLGEIVYFYRRPKGDLVRKSVHYFLMEAQGDRLGKPNWEVSEARWVPITEVHTLLSYEGDKGVVQKARDALGT